MRPSVVNPRVNRNHCNRPCFLQVRVHRFGARDLYASAAATSERPVKLTDPSEAVYGRESSAIFCTTSARCESDSGRSSSPKMLEISWVSATYESTSANDRG